MADLAHDLGHHDEHEGLGVDNRKLAMWVFLSSEFMFFGALISTYLLFKGREGLTHRCPGSCTTSRSRRSVLSCC